MKKQKLKRPNLESVLRFFDDVDDFIISTLMRLRRSLSRKPRERRQVQRNPDTTVSKERKSGGAE